LPFELAAGGDDVLAPVALGALLVLLVVALVLRGLGGLRRRRRQARQRRSRRGEQSAVELLERLGFTVVAEQATARWQLSVGDRNVEVESRADLIVELGGRRYVADVKTGGQVPDPRHPATRRQLLEYLCAFEADGALLVDMEGQSVVEVSFPGLRGGRHPR
jgi:hypothetical protein